MGRDNPRTDCAARSAVMVVALLLSLAAPVFAQSSATTFRTIPWELMVAVAIMAAYTVVAIAFLIAEGFTLPEVKAWATNEMYQITAMLILAMIVFVAVRAENAVFESFGYHPSPVEPSPPITSAKAFLDSSRDYLVSVASSGYTVNAVVIALTKKRALSLGGVTAGKAAYSFFDLRDSIEQLYRSSKDIIGMAVGGIQVSFGIVTAQRWFLDLIARTAFTVFLPIGILLRTFSFSRGVGSFFIAISISFYLVYPLTFLMDQKIMDYLLCPENVQTCPENAWMHIRETRLPTLSAALDPVRLDNLIGKAGVGALTGLIGSFVVLFTETSFAFVTFTMLAILNFVITAGVTRNVANLMGYDVRLDDLIKIL